MYEFYAQAPRPFRLSAMEDQELAALVMNGAEAIVLWGTGLVIFCWYQRATAEREPFAWAGKRAARRRRIPH